MFERIRDVYTEGLMAKDNNANIQVATETDPNLLRMLDRGIDDVQAGRVVPHREAMAEVGRIREARRNTRMSARAAANG
ncbi:MAG: hypothetical protein IJT96_08720 [Lachnospiraceae bacterium]|nr:hypothetical protein [Lachnospiraceae bacterium]